MTRIYMKKKILKTKCKTKIKFYSIKKIYIIFLKIEQDMTKLEI